MTRSQFHLVHLDISGTLMVARCILILPAEIETDVLGDDKPFAAWGLVVIIGRIGWLFANEPRRMVAQEGFDGNETATDDQQVGLDDTGYGSAIYQGPELIRNAPSHFTHIHMAGVMMTQV